MPAPSTLAAPLIAAYRAAHYRVSGLDEVLRVDHANAALRAALAAHGAACAALVTACNPRSQRLSAARNAQATQAMADALQQAGWPFATAVAQDPSGQWPDEASFLIWHMPLAQARELATAWAQNALLWSAADGVPRLILCGV